MKIFLALCFLIDFNILPVADLSNRINTAIPPKPISVAAVIYYIQDLTIIGEKCFADNGSFTRKK